MTNHYRTRLLRWPMIVPVTLSGTSNPNSRRKFEQYMQATNVIATFRMILYIYRVNLKVLKI